MAFFSLILLGQHCPAGFLIIQSMGGNKNLGFFGLMCSLMVLTVANSALLHGTLEVHCLCVGTRSTSRRCRIAQSESKTEIPQASSSTFFKLSDFHQELVSFYKCHFSSKSLDFAGYMTKMACQWYFYGNCIPVVTENVAFKKLFQFGLDWCFFFVQFRFKYPIC